MPHDPRIAEYQLDMDAEVKQRQRLAEAGITKPEDLASGRIDMGTVSELMTLKQDEDALGTAAAEKLMRDREWMRQAQGSTAGRGTEGEETPPQSEPSPENDRLAALEQQAQAAKAEADKWKALYGRSENKVGDVRRRLAELEARVQNTQAYVDSRQITGRGGDEILTAQEVTNLLMSMANAFGNQIKQAKEEAILVARNPQAAEPGIPVEVESELLTSYPWLANLPPGQKERAMMDIVSTQAAPAQPPPQLQVVPQTAPKPAVAPEQARARVREAAFIEPSNRGSQAERLSVTPERIAYQQKMEKLREALDKPGGNVEAEKILASMGAGLVDDREVNYTLRRR